MYKLYDDSGGKSSAFTFDTSNILDEIRKQRTGEVLPEKVDPEIFKEMSARGFSMIRLAVKVPQDGGWQKACTKRAEYDPKRFNGFNAGVACGDASGVVVWDVDDMQKAFNYVQENGLDIPDTFTVATGRDAGLHKYYLLPKDGKRYGKTSQKKNGFDILGNGAQVVCPGSVHPDTKRQYKILHDIPIAPAPRWMLDFICDEKPKLGATSPEILDSLKLPSSTKDLIMNPPPKPDRSEAEMSVINSMVAHRYEYNQILSIMEQYPIGEKHRESGSGRYKRLQKEIENAKKFTVGVLLMILIVRRIPPRMLMMFEIRKYGLFWKMPLMVIMTFYGGLSKQPASIRKQIPQRL